MQQYVLSNGKQVDAENVPHQVKRGDKLPIVTFDNTQ